MKNKYSLSFLILFTSLLFSATSYAVKPIYSGGKERAAIKGYDPVAYFTENKAIKGSSDFVYEHNGARWLFANELHRTAFIANPEKYSPQYGGYCAYAVSTGKTASIKPEFYTIHEGKLYLNYSGYIYKKWVKDKETYIDAADSEWPKLVTQK